MLKNKFTIGLLFFLLMILSTAQLSAQKRYSGRKQNGSIKLINKATPSKIALL